MSPINSFFNAENGLVVNPIICPYLPRRSSVFYYLNRLRLSDFTVVRFPLWVAVSRLFYHIRHILFRRAEKKVVWVDTAWVVATMADKEPFWDRAVVDLPRQPVSPFPLNHAISFFRPAAGNIPAACFRILIGVFLKVAVIGAIKLPRGSGGKFPSTIGAGLCFLDVVFPSHSNNIQQRHPVGKRDYSEDDERFRDLPHFELMEA